MAAVRLTGDAIEVRLSAWEKVAALHGDLTIPREAVAAVEVVPQPLQAVRGLRSPGLALPGRRKAGTWRSRAGKQFVVVRRGQPALRLQLRGQPYDAVVIGTDDAESLAAELTARSGS